jgi:queuine tRNA-ribosyltransferase
LGAQLNTIHNLRYYQNLMSGMRDAIENDCLDQFVDDFYQQQGQPRPE